MSIYKRVRDMCATNQNSVCATNTCHWRYANVNLAVASGLQRWSELFMHVGAYDINCQYRLHFNKRMKTLCETLEELKIGHLIKINRAKLFPWTVAGVGKFHLARHCVDCRYRWSFNFLPYSTMMDGEAAERIWSVTNALGNRTREMNPGHRHNAMNEFYSDQNIRHVHNIGKNVYSLGRHNVNVIVLLSKITGEEAQSS